VRPVLILQHLHQDGPAYLATWLRARGRPFQVVNTEAGEDFPASVRGYAALAVLGGEMSANDPLPSLRQAERLIHEAMATDVPVLGHCLGGQLMARALGAAVVASPAPEIGWHRIALTDDPAARAWLGDADDAIVFQWHYDAFDVPVNAQRLAGSAACPHQAFAVGPHLAMQFHVELDQHKLHAWIAAHDERFLAAAQVPTVHDGPLMLRDARVHLARQQAMAARIYERWMAFADGGARGG
jgi:GMP synthase (glutamine-hydrolysing)